MTDQQQGQPTEVSEPARDDLFRMMLTARAVAAECEQRLKGGIKTVFDVHHTADTWRIAGVGVVAAAQNNDRTEVVDQAALVDWVARTYPTEVTTVTVTQVRNPAWLAALLEELLPVTPPDKPDDWEPTPGDTLPARDADGAVVPGVLWRMGGDFRSASITPERALVKQLAVRAREFVASGGRLPPLRGRAVLALDPDTAGS